MAEGIVLLRLPLPFALNHINTYLLDEGDGWALIDCGVDCEAARQAWDAALASPLLGGRPVRRILVTHHHPDHIGLAGWLSRRFDAPMSITAGEHAVAGRYSDPTRDIVSERMAFWREHGLPEDLVSWLLQRMPRYSKHVQPLPDKVALVNLEEPVLLGRKSWRPIIGRGHSPEHLSLYDASADVLISGDQILPEITPNIAVWPGGDQNPLQSFLDSLGKFMSLGGDPLVLPSHKQPFRGLVQRVIEFRHHHDERLGHLADACARPMTCFEALPALFGRPLRNEELGFGLGEGVAHLNYLEGRGALSSALDEHGARRYLAA
ncbi:MAG: MBL fold metallo-hydrolase [Proteobacteria bacterium]|nr:MBL fold metallo-hydrolase [Pseudomonadota bacterium]